MKKLVFLPYDMDTALGINNEGALVFGYNLEDTDHLESGADVYNGQQSVLWNNLRDAFGPELKEMYQKLRSDGALSYAKAETMFEEHQALWPEAIFNDDAWFKYIDPLIEKGTAIYLPMLQGSKAEQRKWWLYHRFRYIDSKYNAGDSLNDFITLRGYAKADIKVVPYADIYPSVKYGSYLVQKRGSRGNECILECPLDNVSDTEIYVYDASLLASVGDLSGLKVGLADFSKAIKLVDIKVGDASEGYSNGNLKELYLGNNTLLQTVDARNCVALSQAVDLSGCSNIEHIYFDGTIVTGVKLPTGGIIKTLHLPETVTNLEIINQKMINNFVVQSYANIGTLRLEHVSAAVDSKSIIQTIAAGSRVRLVGIDWSVDTYEEASALYDTLDTMRGLDQNGNNVDTAQVSGTLLVDTLTGAQMAEMQDRYPNVVVKYNHVTSYLYYYNYDGSQLLHTEAVYDGGDGEYTGTPSRTSTAQYSYTFAGWSLTPNGQADVDARKAITVDRNVYAAYTATVRTYTVYFYCGTTLLQTVNNVPYGGTATYTGSTPVDPEGNEAEFEGWSPSNTNIQGNTSCYAQFASVLEVAEITDDWDTILASITDRTYKSRYKVGNYKPLDLGLEGVINMQIAGFDKDNLADGSGTAAISWICKELPKKFHRMNPARVGSTGAYTEGTGTIGGWEKSEMRTYLIETVKPLIPDAVRSAIKAVAKTHTAYNTAGKSFSQTTTDEVWLLSKDEIFSNSSPYKALFPDFASRIKMKVGTKNVFSWWLRSAYSSPSGFDTVNTNGNYFYEDADYILGVAFGFCI